MAIKFNSISINEKAEAYIVDALFNSGLDSDKYTHKASNFLELLTKSPKVLLTGSCTAALEMAAILLDLQPGDEVIMPSYTFVSTANAFVLRGAIPVFVDIREDTLNIDEQLIEEAITSKTKAIVPVHYAGVSCEMDSIMAIAEKHSLYVIEDAAQCVGARYKGRHLGTIGHLGALSFHHTKNITSGLGGALLINEEKFIERAKIIWQKGTNREEFLAGQVNKYTWKDVGSSFMMPEISAALLFSQLEQLDQITKHRLASWNQYYQNLKNLEVEGFIRLPLFPQKTEHNAHLFYLLCENTQKRHHLINLFKENAIQSTFHYIPLHSTAAGERFSRASGDLCVTNRVANCLIRLPLHACIRKDELTKICEILDKNYRKVIPLGDL